MRLKSRPSCKNQLKSPSNSSSILGSSPTASSHLLKGAPCNIRHSISIPIFHLLLLSSFNNCFINIVSNASTTSSFESYCFCNVVC
ncbi:hypothetical protein [Escherichia phage dw-ec]|nr:hypothetical protein [Escherichia phage dw-ec]